MPRPSHPSWLDYNRMSCTVYFSTSLCFYLSDWIAFWFSPLRNCPSLFRLSIDFHLKICTVIYWVHVIRNTWMMRILPVRISFFLFDNAVCRRKFMKNKTMICFARHRPIPNYGISIRKAFFFLLNQGQVKQRSYCRFIYISTSLTLIKATFRYVTSNFVSHIWAWCRNY
jgi:hypothetical protein